MNSPIERAADAIKAQFEWESPATSALGAQMERLARAALEAAIDEAELARVLARENDTEWDYSPDNPDDVYLRDARAIKNHLLGEIND